MDIEIQRKNILKKLYDLQNNLQQFDGRKPIKCVVENNKFIPNRHTKDYVVCVQNKDGNYVLRDCIDAWSKEWVTDTIRLEMLENYDKYKDSYIGCIMPVRHVKHTLICFANTYSIILADLHCTRKIYTESHHPFGIYRGDILLGHSTDQPNSSSFYSNVITMSDWDNANKLSVLANQGLDILLFYDFKGVDIEIRFDKPLEEDVTLFVDEYGLAEIVKTDDDDYDIMLI